MPFLLHSQDAIFQTTRNVMQQAQGETVRSPSAIANTPAFIKGVINLRGVGVVVDSVSDVLTLILLDIEKLMTGADMALVETAAH